MEQGEILKLEEITAKPEGVPTESPEQWLAEHGDVLFRFAILRVGNRHLAEDLVQETFMKAIADLANFRGDSSVRTWLFQILRNGISSHFQKTSTVKGQAEKQAQSSPISLGQLLAPELTSREFATALEKHEFWVAVNQCFQQVPEHLLETFLLRLANPDEKIEELCKQLNLSPSNFSVRLFRTRLLLRRCLECSWMNE